MSCIAALSFSESIDSVACRGRAQMRLECRAVNDVDRSVEQSGYIFLEAHIVVNRALGPRLKLNQNIEVAVGAICAARNGAEYGRMRDAARPQGALMAAKGGKGILSVHMLSIIQGPRRRESYCNQDRRLGGGNPNPCLTSRIAKFHDHIAERIGAADETRLDHDGGVGLLEDRGPHDRAADWEIEARPHARFAPFPVEPDGTRSESCPGERRYGCGGKDRGVEGVPPADGRHPQRLDARREPAQRSAERCGVGRLERRANYPFGYSIVSLDRHGNGHGMGLTEVVHVELMDEIDEL